MRVTLGSLAKQLGLSKSTVSRALNGHPRISDETIRRVEALAEEMGYIPNEVAKGLRRKETRVLGFITQGFTTSYSGNILQAVEETAFEEGYSVIVGTSRGNPEIEKEVITTFLGRRVDGIIIVPIVSGENAGLYKSLLQQKFPFIFVDRHLPEVDCGYITTHNYRGARQAMLHLWEEGYRRIACLVGQESSCFEVRERIRGYIETLDEHRLSYKKIMGEHGVDPLYNFKDYGYLATRQLFSGDNGPDAIFAINDDMAIGALRACVDLGIDVPKEVGIIGFDNLEIDAYLPISLSSVRQPEASMGSEAARWIIRGKDHGGDYLPLQKLLEPRLIIRESTRRRATLSGTAGGPEKNGTFLKSMG